MQKKHWVMDWETLVDCSLVVFEEYKSDETYVFTMCKSRNDFSKLLDFLKQNIQNNEWHISFNGLAFDAQITEFLIRNSKRLSVLSGEHIAKEIYKQAQKCIERSNAMQYPEYHESSLRIGQIDIFKLNHWDNPAKRSSLKYIQFTTDWYNIQDMPISHHQSITTVKDLKTVASYCRNDVKSTKFIAMEKCSKLIELRGNLSKQYDLNLYSASEPKIAKEIFTHLLSQKLGIERNKLKRMRTHRKSIQVKKIILPYTTYKTHEMKKMLFNFQHLTINALQTKNAFKYSFKYRGLKIDMGLGGIHGAKKGLYSKQHGMIIRSSDVVSYYPNLAIRNKWVPAHFPQTEFTEQYEWFFDERRKIPKKDPRNYVYKIILNSIFGLSIDKHSPFYDVELGMKITINGQLSLLILLEMIAERIPGCIPLMINTDGIESMIPEKYDAAYLEVCKEWQVLTKLELEHDLYEKIVIPDVNNYVGVYTAKEITKEEWEERKIENPTNIFIHENGKYLFHAAKAKGRFDFLDLALHKNKSFLIIRKALFNFFVHNIEPEETLKSNKNIFDYCAGVKANKSWEFYTEAVINGIFVKEPQQKTIRYYTAKKGCKIMKCNIEDGRIQNVQKEGTHVIFNVYKELPWEAYNIDYMFYLKKIRKEISNLIPNSYKKQNSLFE